LSFHDQKLILKEAIQDESEFIETINFLKNNG
jgi:hypothetical protein